jgi:hypothetical protein
MKSVVTIILIAVLAPVEIRAADVEPRLYSNIPAGMNFVSVSYANSSGEVTFDSSIPVEDVDGEVDSVVLSYSRSLNIAGKSALLTVAVPYAELGLEGLLLGEPASGRRRGFGDPQVRLAVNFYGAPATIPKNFASYQQKTIVGASISVGMPFGRYLDDKVLNVGTNRWNVVGQVGLSHKINRWTVESAIGISWTSDNDDVVGNKRLEQDPIGLFRGTVLYNFSRGFWVGAGVLYANGGDTKLDGVQRDDRQKNWRTGIATSFSLAPRHNLQLRITEGVTARIGADFRTYSANYTYTF